jgi:hypothetical protein
MMKGQEPNDVICKYCTLKVNNKNTSPTVDREGQNMGGAMIPQERKERGLRGLKKGQKEIILFYSKPKSLTSYYPKSY